MFKNAIKHFCLITRHKFVVLKLCVRAGIIWRGLMHDLSKYSPIEFWEGVKYFDGTRSPNANSKHKNGYSLAWLHHFGRNMHHYEFWYDYDTPNPTPIIPYKYAVEMVCDGLAAGMIYAGKKWTSDYQLNYWNRKMKQQGKYVNPKIIEFNRAMFEDINKHGIKKAITKKNFKEKYKEYVLD